MVRLVRGEGHDKVKFQLQRLLGSLHADPGLNVVAATGALLGTAGELLLRLDPYMNTYPNKICLLCKIWYPDTYVLNAEAFLSERAELLDVGFRSVCEISLLRVAFLVGPVRAIGLRSRSPSKPRARRMGVLRSLIRLRDQRIVVLLRLCAG